MPKRVAVVRERAAEQQRAEREADARDGGAERAAGDVLGPVAALGDDQHDHADQQREQEGRLLHERDVGVLEVDAGVAARERAGEQRGQERAQPDGQREADSEADGEEERHAVR